MDNEAEKIATETAPLKAQDGSESDTQLQGQKQIQQETIAFPSSSLLASLPVPIPAPVSVPVPVPVSSLVSVPAPVPVSSLVSVPAPVPVSSSLVSGLPLSLPSVEIELATIRPLASSAHGASIYHFDVINTFFGEVIYIYLFAIFILYLFFIYLLCIYFLFSVYLFYACFPLMSISLFDLLFSRPICVFYIYIYICIHIYIYFIFMINTSQSIFPY